MLKLVCGFIIAGLCWHSILATAQDSVPEFSTAGFFQLENAPRTVTNMNVGWRFFKGGNEHAHEVGFDDSAWEKVNVPHGLELVPAAASGCSNYQGEAWYRKYLSVPETLKNQKVFLHFEGVMGKCRVYLNGKMMTAHFGGYLPFSVDVSDALLYGEENVVAVWCDNSDDPDYPPGKPQKVLDFTYMGGLYRDVWLVAHNKVYITDPNYENRVAGGGLFVSFADVNDQSAKVNLKLNVKNETGKIVDGSARFVLKERESGKIIRESTVPLKFNDGVFADLLCAWTIDSPKLWSPQNPYLYNLVVTLENKAGEMIDGYRRRIGIRGIEFKGKDGFWLNGKPYPGKVIGGNRHQDFALIGNAVPNSLHYKDAKKMRDIGMVAVRNAHCPQDPAFMDACDELGLLVIANTPGWQFWNPKPIFGERVISDIRHMVRRDRNHPSLWFWEPVLNETHYPAEKAKVWAETVLEEYPYPYCYNACDHNLQGAEFFPIHFPQGKKRGTHVLDKTQAERTYFTREWGDNVDNWSSHNSPSRVFMGWGEIPQLVQSKHYASPDYDATCLRSLFLRDTEYVGGTLWHTFDHQRGYHPDPFYGGVMDAFRQKKYSSYMFQSQRDVKEGGAFVFIAHEMTPFSPEDVTVYTNCDSVKLSAIYGNDDDMVSIMSRRELEAGMPHPIMVFKKMYHFMKDKFGDQKNVCLKAEGFVNGEMVTSSIVRPSRRPTQLRLRLDNEGIPLTADGSDITVVVAEITDGTNIKRLNQEYVTFTVEGEGRLVNSSAIMENPKQFSWGMAPALIQATAKAGEIRVRAALTFDGSQKAKEAVLILKSVPAPVKLLYKNEDAVPAAAANVSSKSNVQRPLKKQSAEDLKAVEAQQDHFGEF